MKILHFIDGEYFANHKKTIMELIFALHQYGIKQEFITSFNTDLEGISNISNIVFWKNIKKGKFKKFLNKLFILRFVSKVQPDIVIKWGRDARKHAVSGNFVSISFVNECENMEHFDKSDYIMTNLERVLDYVKNNGFSGAKAFYLPPIIYEYVNVKPFSKRDFFIPEKSKIIYIAGTFKKNIGFENMFEVVSSIQDRYFFIAGFGKDEEHIYDYASRVNMKARSRFIHDIDKSFEALKLSDLAILTFDDIELHKNILQAWLAKKIVITLHNSIALEFIKDGVNGFIVPRNDTYLFRKKLKEVLNLTEEEKNKIIENAYNQAQNFLVSSLINQYIKTFDLLIDQYHSRKNLLHN